MKKHNKCISQGVVNIKYEQFNAIIRPTLRLKMHFRSCIIYTDKTEGGTSMINKEQERFVRNYISTEYFDPDKVVRI